MIEAKPQDAMDIINYLPEKLNQAQKKEVDRIKKRIGNSQPIYKADIASLSLIYRNATGGGQYEIKQRIGVKK